MLLSNNLYEYTTNCSPIPQTLDCFPLWLLWIQLLCMFLDRSFCWHRYSPTHIFLCVCRRLNTRSRSVESKGSVWLTVQEKDISREWMISDQNGGKGKNTQENCSFGRYWIWEFWNCDLTMDKRWILKKLMAVRFYKLVKESAVKKKSSKKQLYWDIIHIHKIHSFKAYNSMTFSILTELENHHHNLILEHVYYSQVSAHLVRNHGFGVRKTCVLVWVLAS